MFFRRLLPQFKPSAQGKCRHKKAMAESPCIQRRASHFCSRQKRRGYTEFLGKMEMGRFLNILFSSILAALLFLASATTATPEQQKPGKKEKPARKDVMNFDGGIFFETDGSLSEITCFRVSGRATAPHFFDGFKRIDDEHGTHYQRGREVVTEFPEELTISLVMLDFPCPGQLEKPGPRRYLTKEMMRLLRFSFYWKRNLELRHIDSLKQATATIEPIE